MKEIKLNVYEKDMVTIKKECAANMVDVPFGIVRKLMALFDADALEDSTKLVTTIFAAWTDVVDLLGRIFPDMEEEDWDTVSTRELISTVYELLKFGFSSLFKIPTSGN